MDAVTMPPLDDYSRLMPIISSWERGQAEFLGALLLRLLAPKSVIDLGCGPGTYLIPFARAGCSVLGWDADTMAGGELTAGQFMRGDLRLPVVPNFYHEFDLCLCIEVGEHLHPEYADVLVKSCCDCAPVIFWSAAHQGQNGLHHYTAHSREWWAAKFSDRGYGSHPKNDETQAAIAADPECQRVGWLISNSVLLCKCKP